MGMTIADTIKSLKPGDRVRVLHEVVVVVGPDYDGDVLVEGDYYLIHDDPTITFIEVIERPLQVGDRVITNSGKFRGRLTAIGEASCLILLDGDQSESCFVTSDLRRAS